MGTAGRLRDRLFLTALGCLAAILSTPALPSINPDDVRWAEESGSIVVLAKILTSVEHSAINSKGMGEIGFVVEVIEVAVGSPPHRLWVSCPYCRLTDSSHPVEMDVRPGETALLLLEPIAGSLGPVQRYTLANRDPQYVERFPDGFRALAQALDIAERLRLQVVAPSDLRWSSEFLALVAESNRWFSDKRLLLTREGVSTEQKLVIVAALASLDETRSLEACAVLLQLVTIEALPRSALDVFVASDPGSTILARGNDASNRHRRLGELTCRYFGGAARDTELPPWLRDWISSTHKRACIPTEEPRPLPYPPPKQQ